MSTPLRIIAVDDEPGLRAMIADYLAVQGCAVRTAEDGAALDRLLAEGPADLLLIDVTMPGEDGIAVTARIRRADSRVGILIVTAVGDEASRVAGLRAGADDYVTKPFELRELMARLRSVARRLPPPAPARPAAETLLPLGRYRLDPRARRLLAPDGTEMPVSAMEFDLLHAFCRHPRQVLSRDRLSELAHGRPLGPEDRSLDIRIARLRKKLEPHGAAFLRTVRGEGYAYEPGG